MFTALLTCLLLLGEHAGVVWDETAPVRRRGPAAATAGVARTEGERATAWTQQQRAARHDGHEEQVRHERHLLGAGAQRHARQAGSGTVKWSCVRDVIVCVIPLGHCVQCVRACVRMCVTSTCVCLVRGDMDASRSFLCGVGLLLREHM